MWWSRRGLRAHCTRDLFEDPNSVERKIHLSGFKTAMIYYDPLIVVTAIKKKIVNSYRRNEVKRQGRGGEEEAEEIHVRAAVIEGIYLSPLFGGMCKSINVIWD